MFQSSKDLITIIASITGMVLGTAGFVLSLVNFFRDRSKIRVNLTWNVNIIEEGIPPDLSKKYVSISVSNIGRRSVYLKAVGLRVSNGNKHTYLITNDSIAGKKLEEGSPSFNTRMKQEEVEQYSKQWREVRAYAQVSTGKTYLSKKMGKSWLPEQVKE